MSLWRRCAGLQIAALAEFFLQHMSTCLLLFCERYIYILRLIYQESRTYTRSQPQDYELSHSSTKNPARGFAFVCPHLINFISSPSDRHTNEKMKIKENVKQYRLNTTLTGLETFIILVYNCIWWFNVSAFNVRKINGRRLSIFF